MTAGMDLLVLGGTGFVGRAVVEEAVRDGWTVTTVNRGLSGPAPDGAEALRADRAAPRELAAVLGDRTWDAVVDTWSGAPAVVGASARLLSGRVKRYVYVSSQSVYRPPLVPGMAEDAPLRDGPADLGDGSDYGANKVGGERAVDAVFGDRALHARAGLILGPYENVGRLPWWLLRVARGGRVLAPGPPELPLQYVDARDLAAWLLSSARTGRAGAYNVVSRPGHATMRTLLEACRQATGSGAELCWTEPEPILAAGVEPWNDLPVWIPPGHEYRPMHETDTSKAHAAGLRCRPVEETVADTWAWLARIGYRLPLRPDRPRPGLDPATEAALLGAAPSPAPRPPIRETRPPGSVTRAPSRGK